MSSGGHVAKRIEPWAPELGTIIDPSAPIQDLADGFGGPHGPAEGPLWWKEGGHLLVGDFVLPNGLAFSPDEAVLYINDTRRRHIRAFDLLPNGTLAKQTDRVFADLAGDEPGVPDGMKVDVEGNVYCGAPSTSPAGVTSAPST